MHSPLQGRARSRRKPMAEINVVPYIDVSLVLLIIFMITAPLIQTGVDVNLPRVDAAKVSQKKEAPLIVQIDAQGSYKLIVSHNEPLSVAPDELLARVQEFLRDKPETAVLVGGDEAVPYGRVIEALAMLRKSGVQKVELMTRPIQ